MTISVNVINALVGPSHLLVESDVSNWSDIISLVTTDPCDFEIHYNGNVLTGSIAKSSDGLTLLVGFDDPDIALPGGMCLLVTCASSTPPVHECYPDTEITVTTDSKLLVLDETNCPIGFVRLDDLIDLIRTELDIPQTLCDLITDGIPTGNLVAGDRILTTTGDPACTLKAVPQSQVVCS